MNSQLSLCQLSALNHIPLSAKKYKIMFNLIQENNETILCGNSKEQWC